jgi:lipopolysaccharide export system permease protein
LKRAFGYLAAELTKSYALLGVALLALFDLLAFMAEAEDIGDGQYGVIDALMVVAYRTPALLVDLSPFVALLATLNAYAAMSANSELIALRAAGISVLRLGAYAGIVAAVFMVGIAAVETGARPLHLEAGLLRMQQTAPSGNQLHGSGFWIRVGTTIVNVASLEHVSQPSGISEFEFDSEDRLRGYLFAASADIVSPTTWQLHDVERRQYDSRGAPTASAHEASSTWQPVWDASTRLYDLTLSSFSLVELYHRLGHANRSITARTEQAEFWHRIALPLSAIAYALLAAPFAILSTIRGGIALRLALGAGTAFVLYIGEQLITNASILAGIPIAATALVPPLIILIVAVVAMYRLR